MRQVERPPRPTSSRAQTPAELEWDTLEELRAAFASPEGRATAADAARLQQLAPVLSMIITADVDVMRREPGFAERR